MIKYKLVLMFVIVLLAGFANAQGFVSSGSGSFASSGSSSYQHQPSYQTYYDSSRINTYWPILGNKETCDARQDILLNVAPAGCQPAVVRSDLLAEQNVPVFCQIDALEINPLINIKEIENIRFTGKYPSEIVGTGFHPARAALRSRNALLGDPLINNIGYVVVVLKKTEKESDLPEFVNVTLSAQIEYDSGNAFGIGRAEFILGPIESDSDWEELSDGEKNSFWRGRYFLRLEEIESDYVIVSVYEGDKKITTTKVERGKTSSEIYAPGMYCRAGFQINYAGLIGGDDSARIEISDGEGRDIVDVYKGSKFLNNKCSVSGITVEKNGLGSLDIKCSGTRGTIKLERKAKQDGGGLVEIPLENDKKFYEVINAYKKVAEDYPAEGKGEYGQDSLKKAIDFIDDAAYGKKQKTEEEILNMYLERYPDSDYADYATTRLNMLYQVDSSLGGEVIEINNGFRTIRLVGLNKAAKNSSVNIRVANENNPAVKKGDIIYKSGDNLISIIDIEANQISLGHNCKESVKVLKEGESETICGVLVSVRDIDFQGLAKIRLIPKADGTKTETNLTINIGIEKRAVKLSPERTDDMIENLNESVEKWEKISTNLGNVVKGLKGACLATGAILTVKNFFQGIDGTALARQHAMQGDNGWNERCSDAIGENRDLETGKGLVSGKSYKSITECFNDNAKLINDEIRERVEIIKILNTDQGDSAGNGIFDRKDTLEKYYNVLKGKYPSEAGIDGLKKPEGGLAAYYISDLRDLQYNIEMKKKGYSFAESNIKDITDRISLNQKSIEAFSKSQNSGGLLSQAVSLSSGTKTIRARIFDVNDVKGKLSNNGIVPEGTTKAIVVRNAKENSNIDSIKSGNYIVFGKEELGKFIPNEVRSYSEDDKGVGTVAGGALSLAEFMGANNINEFEEAGNLFGNEIVPQDIRVRYFGSGPDKGMPSVVPFNIRDGWYVRVDSNAGFGEKGVYQSSGLPNYWKVCNVGTNHKMNLDDECQRIDAGYNGDVLDLGSYSKQIIDQSSRAILEAARQKGQKIVIINGQKIQQGAPSSSSDGVQCQDFMSPTDCLWLFNICDPVICPATRCNLGGKYPVADVIQSGIVGSTVLCLPNWNEGVKIPVCLTGIQAGIDSYVSILRAHRDCLQESRETGRMVGICDQIYSIYMCDFLWRQASPVANQLLPTLVENLYTGGTRGGGEYSNVAGAWSNAQNSINYMTQVYGANSLKAFKARSVEEVGSEFCKAFISAKAPSSFESLVEPDSPPQFHAWFSSSTFTDATIPATAQYKVFYHIFAGKDAGVHYSIYLKSPSESIYYSVPDSIRVDSGFILRGESNTQTKDFTAPEGYKELCVRIDNKEECGFKEVSTSFAVNYLTDELVKDELGKSGITKEDECISGGAGLGDFVGGNIQQGMEGVITPDITSRGIVRVCATRNPAESTDPMRYVEVGYCGDTNTKCWLDKKSVDNAITDANKGVQGEVLKELESGQAERLGNAENTLGSKAISGKINALKLRDENNVGTKETLLKEIEELYDELTLNSYKAELLLFRADVLSRSFVKAAAPKETSATGSDSAKIVTQDDTEKNIMESIYTLAKSGDNRENISLNGKLVEGLYFEKVGGIVYLQAESTLGGKSAAARVVNWNIVAVEGFEETDFSDVLNYINYFIGRNYKGIGGTLS